MVLSDIDRDLLKRCLARESRSWQAFVDRFLGLVLHVVGHSAQSRSVRISAEDREDLAADVFLVLLENDFAVLRRFRGGSSLATYLTVVARRVVVRELMRKGKPSSLSCPLESGPAEFSSGDQAVERRISDHDQVQQLIGNLNGPEAEIVRMYHLEGKSYREISDKVGMPENSIGPTLSRARSKMRRANADSASH